MIVELLEDRNIKLKSYKKGTVLEVDETLGNRYILMGVAKKSLKELQKSNTRRDKKSKSE